MNHRKLQNMLISHEGFSRLAYKCTAGATTVGYGRNLDSLGVTKCEATFLLDNDIRRCTADLLSIFPDQFESFPENIQMVLIDMRFQMGYRGFRKFKKMIAAVKVQDWPEMIIQMKDSRWYRQVPGRAEDLIQMIEVL